MDIFALVRLAAEKSASDLHLVEDNAPIFRIDGLLRPESSYPPLTAEDIAQAFQQISTEKERANFEHYFELDFGYTLPDVGRLRCNASRQRGSLCLTIRLIPLVVPTLGELGLPEICQDLIMKPRGLVVVSGPSGSGKSTTLAAMIDYLNSEESKRVITLEDPIEYVYTNNKCTITQRELGNDTLSFADALKHVLRQDPDVILVGEMRDLETAAAVLTVAETGHLVLTTGHATSAAQAVERIIDLFPTHERHLAQTRLASLLLGILCQSLVPRIDSPGRVAAVEVMLALPSIKNIIREGRIHQLPNAIVTQARSGMKLLDNALLNLHRSGVISGDSLFAFCNDREEVAKLMGRVQVE
jgi:twitching motility protein PilT